MEDRQFARLLDHFGLSREGYHRVGRAVKKEFPQKLVIIGGFEPTPSQISVLKALIKGSGEVIYHHPYVPGKDRVFKQPAIDLGCELETIDLDMDDEERLRMAMADPWGEGDKVDLSNTMRRGRYLDPLEEARQVAQRISALLEAGADVWFGTIGCGAFAGGEKR